MAERDEKGHFLPGNKASPGRAKRAVEVDFHQLLVDTIKSDDWISIIQRAVTDAKQGDRYARQFIAEYRVGKPPQILELKAAEAALLADVLERMKRLGKSPVEVLTGLQALLSEATPDEDDAEDE